MSEAVSVLLIDDNPEDEELYSRGLLTEGFEVEHVSKDDRLVQVVERATPRLSCFT